MENTNEIVFDENPAVEDEIEQLSSREVIWTPTDPDIARLCARIQQGKIITDPDFQRKYVWRSEQKSRLIESILLKIPLPVIYLAESEDGKCIVIDGQQRLMSIYDFRNGAYRLRKMNAFPELAGKKFSELDEELIDRIDNTGIHVVTFSNRCDPELKFNVFERLNTGAMSLTDQELRNCIYRGVYNDLLKELASDVDFRKLLGLSAEERRMRDVELVLRFAAFFHKTYLNYKAPIKAFLNEEMRKYRSISDGEALELRESFKKAVALVKSLVGDVGFKRFYPGNDNNRNGYWEKKRFNASLYDILMWSFSRADKNLVMHNLATIREAYIDLMTSDDEFIEAIEKSTSSLAMVRCRFKKWDERLEAILGDQVRQPRCFSIDIKKKLFEQNPVCAICQQSISCLDDAAVDHIEQYWMGGQTIEENARLTHRYCNCARSRND